MFNGLYTAIFAKVCDIPRWFFFCHPLSGGAQRQMTFQINQLLLSRILISSLVYKHECDLSKRNDGTMQSANISNPCIHIA